MTYPIADMLTRMRNALLRKQTQVTLPYSQIKEALAKILQREGYIQSSQVLGEKTKKVLVLELRYFPDGTPAAEHLQVVSKPSKRVYCAFNDLKPLRSGMGRRILSTSKGILSDAEAREKKIGGEILVEVW